jgi:hypothetical protein
MNAENAPTLQEVQNATTANAHTESRHNFFKTSPADKPKNLNQFLTSNPDLFNELQANFNHINRDKRINFINPSLHYYYLYDKETHNQKQLNNEILKFVIDLIYYNADEEEKIKLFMISNYLINRKFKPSFKLLTKSTFKNGLTSINDLYDYITSKGKKAKPIFNQDPAINPPEQNIKNCCVCLEDYNENQKINCVNCLNIEMCRNCFNHLNPKKCPLCRTLNFSITENETTIRQINYIYNNANYQENYNFNIDDDEITLIYLGYAEPHGEPFKICFKSFYVDTLDKLKNDFYDNIEDTIFYYNTEFLFNHIVEDYADIIEEEIFNSIVEASHNKQNGKPIMKLCGLIESNIINEEQAEENRKNFFNGLIMTDGLKHTLNKEFLEYAGQQTTEDKKYYIHSSNNYIGDYDIKPQYFKEEFNNNKMVFSHTTTENLFSWRM